MKRAGWLAIAAAVATTALIALSERAGWFSSGPLISHETFADLGPVTILHTQAESRDLVIVLAESAAIPEELHKLAAAGHLVAHVPVEFFLERAAANRDDCLNAVTLLDVFSQHLQQKFRFAQYQRPILIGLDGAAPFALATLAQAPNHLFQAGAGVHFQPEITLPAPPCESPTLAADALGNGRFRIADANAPTPWQTLEDLSALDDYLGGLAEKNADAGSLDDLALVELPLQTAAAAHNLDDVFVILLSGDGGWANIDKDIGEQLNRVGLPVVGWNSLQYFWSEKTPEQASRDLARTIAHYQNAWQRPRVLLIGFSLGGDVLPFMINRLPDATRAAIADTVFLGLGRKVDFQFHVTDWIGSGNENARPIPPELATLRQQNPALPLLCIYGSEDDDTICGDKPQGLDVIELPGDHHFDGDYEKATQVILDHLQRSGYRDGANDG